MKRLERMGPKFRNRAKDSEKRKKLMKLMRLRGRMFGGVFLLWKHPLRYNPWPKSNYSRYRRGRKVSLVSIKFPKVKFSDFSFSVSLPEHKQKHKSSTIFSTDFSSRKDYEISFSLPPAMPLNPQTNLMQYPYYSYSTEKIIVSRQTAMIFLLPDSSKSNLSKVSHVSVSYVRQVKSNGNKNNDVGDVGEVNNEQKQARTKIPARDVGVLPVYSYKDPKNVNYQDGNEKFSEANANVNVKVNGKNINITEIVDREGNSISTGVDVFNNSSPVHHSESQHPEFKNFSPEVEYLIINDNPNNPGFSLPEVQKPQKIRGGLENTETRYNMNVDADEVNEVAQLTGKTAEGKSINPFHIILASEGNIKNLPKFLTVNSPKDPKK